MPKVVESSLSTVYGSKLDADRAAERVRRGARVVDAWARRESGGWVVVRAIEIPTAEEVLRGKRRRKR